MTEPSERPAGGVAIVAGGSGGIGAAVCRRLAEAGADIALTYHRNRDKALDAQRSVEAAGRRASITPVDLADAGAVQRFVTDTAAAFGAVHTVVYAAGPYIDMRHVSRLDPDLFRRTLGTDVFGCYNLVHAALPALRQTRGAIVAAATPAMRRALPRDVLSAAPKAAIEAVIRNTAVEEGRHGVRANCVGVGLLSDGMYHQLRATGDFDESFMAQATASLPLRRIGTAQDIAEAVAFLASDRAAFITGQTLMVDGGFSL
ncbi:SDR family NAD(P)-dependent oxidoreductase [Vineibacter terrae]|uniref:SDR family NAD(P)-dependent oxidoreductase n=1 Tax=Vineibacter terrae TaxID=2586908 RepID=UPI002E356C3B|nr:SDR family oxidoreductase [Vineibacter terrae]HEX2885458.1 SDR family oxidoreductase [Vineibacter terrae]